jgi:hypothetical protein
MLDPALARVQLYFWVLSRLETQQCRCPFMTTMPSGVYPLPQGWGAGISQTSMGQPSLWHLHWSCQESGQGQDEQKPQKILGIHNWTYIRALCHKNEGSVEIKQRLTKMGGRTTYRTLSPKRAPFQIGIDWWSHLWKVPRKRWISHTYPMWLWGHSLFKISSPGPLLHGTKWLLLRPLYKVLHFIRGMGLLKG